MKLFIIFPLLLITGNSNAQLGKKLKDRVKQAAEQKANQKVDEKINKGVDKGVETIDSVITGKKKLSKKEQRQQEKKEAANNRSTNTPTANGTVEFESSELIFQTSIKGKANKAKMEKLLQDMDGVSNAMIDEDTGIVYITPTSGADINKTAIDLIKKNGFTVVKK